MLIPGAGDIAWIDFGETLGTEQSGRRPGLILTADSYHEVSARAIVCPITSKDRGWPTNVRLPSGLKTEGVVLVDQIRAIDRQHRLFDVIEQVPESFLNEVRQTWTILLNLNQPGVAS